MARFDLYGSGAGSYLLDVQTDLISGLNSRLVVPLVPVASAPRPIRRLHPVFEIEGANYVLATHLLTAVPGAALGPPVGNLDAHYDRIFSAINMIFNGF